MAVRFSGTFQELKTLLSHHNGIWTEINPNQYQFRHENGGVLNWYPSTGAITFQGQPRGRDALKPAVPAFLQKEGSSLTSDSIPAFAVADQDSVQIEEATDIEQISPGPASAYELRNYPDSEIVIALVGAVGTEMDVIINGGAAVALLAVIGHLAQFNPSKVASFAFGLLPFTFGALAIVITSSLTYFSQWLFDIPGSRAQKTGFVLNILCIALGLVSYACFAWGIFKVYQRFHTYTGV